MRHSLLTRFALPYVLLTLLVMGGLNLAVTYSLRNTYTENLKVRLLGETRGLAGEVTRQLAKNPSPEAMEELATTNSRLLNSRVTIILSDGTVIGELQYNPI